MTSKEINAAQRLSADMMKPKNLLAALDRYEKHPLKSSERKQVIQSASSSEWPERPARTPGVTSCNTRCENGSCWRTYDSGKHKHFIVPPTMDPFTNQMKFETPPC